MSVHASVPPVRHVVTVEAPREHAFQAFTSDFDTWWSRDHYIGKEPIASAVMESRQEGRVFEHRIRDTNAIGDSYGAAPTSASFSSPSRLSFGWSPTCVKSA